MTAESHDNGARVLIGRGTRQTEALLFAELEADLDRLGRSLLHRPVLLVVPSQSLRQHLLAGLAARRPAVAGLWCRTLYGLAAELMRQAGMRVPGRLDPLMLVARRLARDEPSLRRSFDHLVDGYRSAAASVSDLMDAAFDSAHAEGLEEALAAEGPEVAGRQALERARAIVRVAARSGETLEELALLRRPTVLLRAAELLRGGAPAMFAPGAVHIYGFADASGVATDLIEALLERHAATLFLDQPVDLAEPGGEPAGSLFGRRFRQRVFDRAPASAGPAGEEESSPTRLEAFRALGAGAEAREVARRLRALLDAGAATERLGVVGRRLDPYVSPLRVQLRRYGVPFSGLAARGPATPAGRITGAVLELLLEGHRAPVERWLDARQTNLGKTPSFDLRLALHSLGAARLEELAGLPLDKLITGKSVPLPVRLGFDQATQPAGGDHEQEPREKRVRLRRRSVSAASVREAARQAKELCKHLGRWPAKATLARHFELFRGLLSEGLGWQADHPLTAEIDRQLEEGLVGLEETTITRDELHLALRELLGKVGRERLGGAGAGVQVLDATEARGRTFDHLFLIGLNGGLFPRTLREDPLLSDPLRRVLTRSGTSVLPDLPVKREGSEEERYLFAQLLSAAPAVTLSWQQVDDDNGARTVSPLVERLRWSDSSPLSTEPPLVRPAYAPQHPEPPNGTAATVPRPLMETAVEAALRGRRAALEPILALGFEELTTPRKAAAARLRVLDELDPPARSPALGPYLGIVGPPLSDDDPRRDETLFITTLERMCGCPWQTLLTRLLRLEPLPDPLDTLPRISPLLVGNVVHRVAEVIVKRQLGESDDGRMPPPGRLALPIAWPERDELEKILVAASQRALADSGVALPGFARVVALAVRPYLDELRDADWPGGTRVPVLGSEVRNEIELPEDLPPRRLAFRVDRIDGPNDRPLYTDYKTGRGFISKSQDPKWQQRAMLAEVHSGLRLQVPAYALAGGGSGRYLFLHPEFTGIREITVEASDAKIAAAFTRAVAASLTAWRQGAFPPRVVAANRDAEPDRCNWCEVAQACLRGDSAVRRRLRAWAGDEAGESGGETEKAALALWRLPLKEAER